MQFPVRFTVIALCVAGTAAATPKQEEISGRVSINEDTSSEPRTPEGWVELASETPAKHGNEYVMVGSEAGYFSQLRLKATHGRTGVRRVKIFFADGGTRTIRLFRSIRKGGHDTIVISLGAARPIDRLVISTDRGTKGRYAVYGSSSGGGTVVGSR
jgi:hypothetical protein